VSSHPRRELFRSPVPALPLLSIGNAGFLAFEILTPACDKNSQLNFVTVIKLQHKRKWRARRRASADLDGQSLNS
jgi:hypothetical protein